MNIFANAAVKPAAKTAAAKKSTVIDSPALENKVEELQGLRTIMANTEARVKMLEGIIKEQAQAIYLAEYSKLKRRPETLKIADATGSMFSFIVMDRYTKVEDEKAEAIKAIDPELLDTTTVYSFNPDMLDKYGQQISEAITGMDIPDADKAALITAEIKTTVRKGTIERLYHYPEAMEVLYSIINPVTQIKSK